MFSDNTELIGQQNISCEICDGIDPRFNTFIIRINKKRDEFFVNKMKDMVSNKAVPIAIYYNNERFTVLHVTETFTLKDLFYMSFSMYKSGELHKAVYDFFSNARDLVLTYDVIEKNRDIFCISLKKDVY